MGEVVHRPVSPFQLVHKWPGQTQDQKKGAGLNQRPERPKELRLGRVLAVTQTAECGRPEGQEEQRAGNHG
jgi:hypothetical protein